MQLTIEAQNDCTPAVVKLLLKHGAVVNETGKGLSALMMASCYGDIEAIEMLLRNGADIDHKNEEMAGHYFALWIAAMEEHAEVVKILLNGHSNVNLKGNNRTMSILQGVMKCNEMPEDKMVAILKLLLDNGAEGQHKILITTIESGRLEVLKLLLDELKINNKHGSWGYPLMAAAQSHNDRFEMVQSLLEAGAQTDILDEEGKSLLMVARNVKVAKQMMGVQPAVFSAHR